MATKKTKRFQEGGISDKDRGLEASKDDKVGFFERLRMGNIDDEGSEAYRRFGAGRGKSIQSPAPVEDRTPTPVIREKPEEVRVTPLGEEPRNNAVIQGRPQQSGDAAMAEMYQGPRTKPIVTQQPKPGGKPSVSVAAPTKSSPTKSTPAKSSGAKTSAYPMTGAQPSTKTYSRSGGASADELANYKPSAKKTGADAIPGQNVKPVVGEKIEPMSDAERNINNMMIGTGVGAGVLGLYKTGKSMLNARKAAKAGAKKREALKRDVEEGIDRNLAEEVKNYSASAAEKAIAAKAARTRDLKAGQAKTKFTSQSKKPSKKTKKFDDSESNVEFKRGGKAYSSGGAVNKASKRADGIATRGKTRCKIR